MGFKAMCKTAQEVFRHHRVSPAPMGAGAWTVVNREVAKPTYPTAPGADPGKGRAPAGVIGKVIRDRRKAYVGDQPVCVEYCYGRCSATKSGKGCVRNGREMLHKCAVLTSVGPPPKICGGDHVLEKCPSSV